MEDPSRSFLFEDSSGVSFVSRVALPISKGVAHLGTSNGEFQDLAHCVYSANY